MGLTYLEAVEGSSSGEGYRSDGSKYCRNSKELGLHRSILRGLVLPALESGFGAHARSSSRLPCPRDKETDTTTVGRLHYSLSPALSAQFRRDLTASEHSTTAGWYRSTSQRADYRDS